MSIDWFTVVAQILNFLILVWLLKRFLYQPILDAIDTREQRIANELGSADTLQREAQLARDKFAQKNAEFEQQKQALMQEAIQAADTERTRLIVAARQQADFLEKKRRLATKREQHNLQVELRRLVSSEVFSIARKALTDLAASSLEQRITEMFITRLQAMESEKKNVFIEALSSRSLSSKNEEYVQVGSTFDLQPRQKVLVQSAINDTFSGDIPLQFETTTKLICGIRLSFKGQQISWSIDEYLASLEKVVGGLFQSVSDRKSSDPDSEAAIVDLANSESTKPETTKSLADKKKPVPEMVQAKTAEAILPKSKKVETN